jgi:hypothetical protein
MSDLENAIAEHHTAVQEFLTTGRAMTAQQWAAPRAPGKWTPGQIAEHLAITYEYGIALAKGNPPGGRLPFFIRPIVRRAFVNPTLKAGRFTRSGKTPKIFEPSTTPPAANVVLPRLETALSGFENAIQSGVPEARHTLRHPFFGKVPTTDYLRLQTIHAKHHHGQLAASAQTGSSA